MKERIAGPFPAWVQWASPAPKRHLQNVVLRSGLRTGLDIGCGDVSCLTPLRRFGLHSTGIDISAETIESCKQRGIHDAYVCGSFMAFEVQERFDVVVMSHVIEHFGRDAGMDALRKVESLAHRLVYVETPCGFLEQTAFDGNPFQRHLSGWFPQDFAARGYTVYGAGLKFLSGPVGRPRLFPPWIVRTLNRLTQIYTFRHPNRSFTIAAFRYIDEAGDLRRI